MPRILAYTSPARGHLYPLTPILDVMQRRGYDVSVRTLAAEVPRMAARGFDAAPISAEVESVVHDDWQGGNPRAALVRAMRVFTARAEHDAADLDRAIAHTSPDVLVVDINCWGALAVAERWGGAWAAICPYPLALRAPEVPPFGPGWAPARGVLGRLRDRLLGPLVLGTVDRAMRPGVNRVRRRVGVPELESADALFARPPLLLYLTAPPFEYARRSWPHNIRLVGPCAWEPPETPPAWLAPIDRPIVLVTTSSEFQDDGVLVRTALDALADEPVFVVATVPAGTPSDFAVPANARVEHFVPHGALLGRAACAITHGGMGATQKALAHGVPVCAVPFGRDQLEVARRVEVAGAGTRLPASALSVEALRAKVREAMACRDGAARVARGFTQAGGAEAAADALIALGHPINRSA